MQEKVQGEIDRDRILLYINHLVEIDGGEEGIRTLETV